VKGGGGQNDNDRVMVEKKSRILEEEKGNSKLETEKGEIKRPENTDKRGMK
jgi:hypothetical protein